MGDPLVFTMNDGTTWTYLLTGIEIVGPDAMHIVDQTAEPTATLFACHPKGSAAQRIVAHFRLACTIRRLRIVRRAGDPVGTARSSALPCVRTGSSPSSPASAPACSWPPRCRRGAGGRWPSPGSSASTA